jgi:hypothetical protein
MAESSIKRGGRPPEYPIQRVYGQLYPDGENVADAIYFNKPGGLDFSSYLFNVAKNMTPFMKNWRLDRGTLVQRPGTTAVGPGGVEEVIGLQGFVDSAGLAFIVRVTLDKIQVYDPTTDTWDDSFGPALGASSGDRAYFTGWADHMIVQISSGGIYDFDPVTMAHGLLASAAGVYTTAGRITTFAGRIIVCQADFPYKMVWCTKDNDNDWIGIGSGFEDFFNTPGGSVDDLLAVVPVTDDQAIVVRSNSVWLMVTTGDANVPFKFSKLYSDISCRAPSGITAVPGAAIIPGLDDIYIVNAQEIKAIGGNIRPRYIGSLFHASEIQGIFDEKRGEFVMAVSEADVPYRNVVYRFSLVDQGWSRDEYQTPITFLSYSRSITIVSLEIKDLVGTIGALRNPISFLGSIASDTGILMCGQSLGQGLPGLSGEIIDLIGTIGDLEGPIGSSEGSWFVIREDPTTFTDYNKGFDLINKVDTPTELWTGIILGNNKPPTLLGREKVTDAQLEYLLSSVSLEVDVDWSPDGGLSWQQFSRGNIASTLGVPSVLRFAHTFEAAQPIIRLTTPKLAGMRTSGFHVFVTDGAMENP